MACEAIPDFLKLGRTKSCFQDSHHFEGLGFNRSERSQEAEFLESSDCAVDGPNVTRLIIGLTPELADQVSQLLPREHRSGGVTRRRIEARQFLAQADQ